MVICYKLIFNQENQILKEFNATLLESAESGIKNTRKNHRFFLIFLNEKYFTICYIKLPSINIIESKHINKNKKRKTCILVTKDSGVLTKTPSKNSSVTGIPKNLNSVQNIKSILHPQKSND